KVQDVYDTLTDPGPVGEDDKEYDQSDENLGPPFLSTDCFNLLEIVTFGEKKSEHIRDQLIDKCKSHNLRKRKLLGSWWKIDPSESTRTRQSDGRQQKDRQATPKVDIVLGGVHLKDVLVEFRIDMQYSLQGHLGRAQTRKKLYTKVAQHVSLSWRRRHVQYLVGKTCEDLGVLKIMINSVNEQSIFDHFKECLEDPKDHESLDKIFCTHGLPVTLRTDNWAAVLCQSSFRIILGRKWNKSQDLHTLWPQANGEVERQNRSILKILKMLTQKRKTCKLN
ncbi:hypothetical protein QZH41_010817, partial [Actinostola sp. cb2023]